MIKIWKPTANSLELLATLESTNDAVLTLAVRETTLFAGHQGGVIKVRPPIPDPSLIPLQIWDLDTLICIRNLRPHKEDILTISVIDSDFYSGCASGKVQHWDKGFNLVNTWKAHDHIVLASCSSGDARGTGGHLITGGNDAIIKVSGSLVRERLTGRADLGLSRGRASEGGGTAGIPRSVEG